MITPAAFFAVCFFAVIGLVASHRENVRLHREWMEMADKYEACLKNRLWNVERMANSDAEEWRWN
jgi:hypothetical protein